MASLSTFFSKDYTHLRFPKKGAPAEDIKKFIQRFCDFETGRRREQEHEWLLAKAMTDDNLQWLSRNNSRTVAMVSMTRGTSGQPCSA